jgi:hypothetical protein
LHRGSRIPGAAGCKRCTKCSLIELAYTEDKETGRSPAGDGQFNQDEKEQVSEEKVGQNSSMFHQLLYVSSLSVLVPAIFRVNGEQKLVNIG